LRFTRRGFVRGAAAVAAAAGLGTGFQPTLASAKQDDERRSGRWVTGDFHTHTWLTDGSHTQVDVVSHAFQYGLDWMANSEHGGISVRMPDGTPFPSPVWRWITLKDYSYPIIQDLRKQYRSKLLVQGLEWNVPTHEHASVGIVADEPKAISDFEYMFDQSDKDTSRASEGLPKLNKTHANAVAGAKWLYDHYRTSSYYILNHPSRKLLYTATDIRDFIDAAPGVAIGLEGFPGHQKEAWRGGYGGSYGDNTYKARTYGGADLMLAKVGGLMDSLWGEGRKYWVFVNSDFHSSDDDADFWPGEYAKTYTYINGGSYRDLIAGLRSGNSFIVHGDLINALDFSARSKGESATMGQTLRVDKGDNVHIKIRFRCPATNNSGARVDVDHIDLIAGHLTGPYADRAKDTNESAQVVRRFARRDWDRDDGWYVITYQVQKAAKSQYFRLRGTNLGVGVPNETDANGNPLIDDLVAPNTIAKAYADLWFYSNPIFVKVI